MRSSLEISRQICAGSRKEIDECMDYDLLRPDCYDIVTINVAHELGRKTISKITLESQVRSCERLGDD